MLTIQFTLTPKDLISAAQRQYVLARLQPSMVGILLVIAVLSFGGGWLIGGAKLSVALTYSISISVLFLCSQLAGFLLIPGRMRKRYRSLRQFSEALSYGWDDQGLHVGSEHSRSVIGWPDIPNWQDLGSSLAIYMLGGSYVVLPRRAFSSDEEKGLVGQMETVGIEPKYPGWKTFARAK